MSTESRGIHTSLAPAEAQARLVADLAHLGVEVAIQAPGMISGAYTIRQRKSLAVALFLLMLCVVPAVVYLLLQPTSKTETFTLSLVSEETGTRIHGIGEALALQLARQAVETLPR